MNTTPPSFDPVNATKTCFNKYAVFTGRASRSEYWFFWLATFIVGLLCTAVDALIGITALAILWNLAILIPSVAVAVRRLHDTGRSGWNLLWVFLPFVGALLLIIFFCQASKGPNQYGEGPAGPVA